MNNFLEHYTVTLTTQSPVHVGCGEKLTKKDYIRLSDKVLVVDMAKLYKCLNTPELQEEFKEELSGKKELKEILDFLLPKIPGTPRPSFIVPQKMRQYVDMSSILYPQFKKYDVDCGDVFKKENSSGKDKKTSVKGIDGFVRNAYGQPYIPGSSLKGALRTIVLSTILKMKSKEYLGLGDSWYSGRNICHDKTAGKIETKALRKQIFLDKNDEVINSAVNDVFRSISISDSDPLENDNVVLCQKIDVAVDGKQNTINTLCECLKPGVGIKFTLSIDTQIFKSLSQNTTALDYIKRCIKIFSQTQHEFYSKFKIQEAQPQELSPYSIVIGGGAGYQTKTVAYSLHGLGDAGVRKVAQCMETQFPRKHQVDIRKGISPHTLKCTSYNNQLYKMGICLIEFKEVSP